MKRRIIKDSCWFFISLVILFLIVDYLLDKTFDARYFIRLFGKSVISAVLYGLFLLLFEKKNKQYAVKRNSEDE